MIEKKTMGYADFECPQYEAKAVTVIVDSETNKVEIYRPRDDDDDWYAPNDCDRFYPTVDEAADALDKYRHELIDKMKDVKNYIEIMNDWESCCNEGDPFYFKECDYLPYRNTSESRNDSYHRRRAERLEKEKDILVGIFRKGFVNIKGCSFRVDDVKRLKWGKNVVEIVLSDGRSVQTASEAEFNVISYLFGNNTSNYTYTHLNKNEDE